MIFGTHAILFAEDAGKARAFLAEALELKSVDAGGGWLIFALPPAELAVHPIGEGDAPSQALYLMCDDLRATLARLAERGVEADPPTEEAWGIVSALHVPGYGPLGIYEPRHPVGIR
jgi:hypothetical protein